MNLTKDQLLAVINTIDFATDNDASYEEYTILESGTSDLEPIKEILYNKYIKQRSSHLCQKKCYSYVKFTTST